MLFVTIQYLSDDRTVKVYAVTVTLSPSSKRRPLLRREARPKLTVAPLQDTVSPGLPVYLGRKAPNDVHFWGLRCSSQVVM
jgi:hypothetical protein